MKYVSGGGDVGRPREMNYGLPLFAARDVE